MSEVFKLSEYRVLDYLMEHVELELDLTKKPVQVKARVQMRSNPERESTTPQPLVLNGENFVLTSLSLNDQDLPVEKYEVTPKFLIIPQVPQDEPFTIQSTAILGENTDLFGLYVTEGTLLVKAETEGLRRVFYCNDRPDNLATYKTTLIANSKEYPILLANGVLCERKIISSEIHSVSWIDNLPKPTYLFAVVAGKLQYSVTHFKTRANREVAIEFYMSPNATPKCDFAKEVLKKAMKWDEEVCQLDCELVQHMVAGVDKYASGASEPTGLNLFNTVNLLACPKGNTDLTFLRVMEVVAHEYFHYWTGNRVTIRDWFNLSFKEGLTTFRAAQFREDLFGTDFVRLLDGKNLDERAPRQSSYTAVRSLYTAAAYEKGADIFRMMMLVLGKEAFYQGMSEFLKSNDGTAVTLENFIDSLSTTARFDLRNFLYWFTETGIPQVQISDEYNTTTQTYALKIKVIDRKMRPIPLVLGLIQDSGKEVLADKLLILDQDEMEFSFANQPTRPIPSLFRSFSAPVIVQYPYLIPDLLVLMRHDTNFFNRCEAMKNLIILYVTRYYEGHGLNLSPALIKTYRDILLDDSLSHWMKAELMALPNEEELIAHFNKPNFDSIAEARLLIQKTLAQELHVELEQLANQLISQEDVKDPQFSSFDIRDVGKRKLLKICYAYLTALNPQKWMTILHKQFAESLGKNMTQTTNTLSLLCEIDTNDAESALQSFYDYWQNDTHALNYWLSIQATAHSPKTLERVTALLQHPAFDITNPNKVYALISNFINNPYGFHISSGLGYHLVAEVIIKLDKINPALAAKLTEGFVHWDKYDRKRQEMMLNTLLLINDHAGSVDIKNSVKKGLSKAPRAADQTSQHFDTLSNISKMD